MAETIYASAIDEQSDRMRILKAFDDTKAGVKGLCDSGLLKLPKIFIRPSEEVDEELKHEKADHVRVTVIDLSGVDKAERRKQIVEEVRVSSETWGFFQLVNHGIPLSVIDGMIDGVRGFHEQDEEEKKKYYTRDMARSVRYYSSHDLFTSTTASWRDTLLIPFNSGSNSLHPQELPDICRNSSLEYSKHVENLGNFLFGLLSEALGLETELLENMECSESHRLVCHYYPACPEPELAIGASKHCDAGFLTILLQNNVVSSLQILYEGQWVDIEPVRGALVVNIGDLLRLVSNGKFRSVEHRVRASRAGPRISVACFFTGPQSNPTKIYGPIKELITKENPAVYRDIVFSEYTMRFLSNRLGNYRALDYYKV